MVAAATGQPFGLFAGALLLPRYLQDGPRREARPTPGLLIYPLLLGLVVVVTLAPR